MRTALIVIAGVLVLDILGVAVLLFAAWRRGWEPHP